MGRIEKTVAAVIGIILLTLIAILILQSVSPDTSESIHSVSVLVNDLNEYTRLGMDKAALDYNLDVHYISDFGHDPVQQMNLIQREITNGVSAIVLEPADAVYIAEKLEDAHVSLPIVTIGDPVIADAKITHVSPDNAALGRMLAARILAEAASTPYTILIEADSDPHVLERCAGMLAAFAEAGKTAECRFVENEASSVAMQLARRPQSVVVTLDEALLPALCEGGRSYDRLYAVGYTGEIRTYLESGYIRALAVYSTFDEGYLSLKAAETAIQSTAPQPDITLNGLLVDGESMYALPQELILFPIAK
ncbi:MAG: substrate-binding domain-containing protein [Eubacteriales bacterium]|nr:substrate-binding domain-containing protein [Eubacteriales bacterium]